MTYIPPPGSTFVAGAPGAEGFWRHADGSVETPREMSDASTEPAPRPEWVRGTCPDCGDSLAANCYYVGGRGYVICWECWSSLQSPPTCSYRKVI